MPVELQRTGFDPVRARIEDLSLSGAKIRLSVPLPALARWNVRIGEHVVPAWIVRRTTSGVGVEWCEFAPGVVATLLRAPTGMRRRPISAPAATTTERVA